MARITNEAELRSLVGEPRRAQLTKTMAALDDHCVRWIAASPFIVVSSVGPDGAVDVSPKGDPAGFVRVLDRTTLAIPDRRGNHRLDTLRNVLTNPSVGVMFMVPGRGEVVRVQGQGEVRTDPHLLEPMAVDGRAPAMALVVSIDQVMFHCGKSVIRSGLWDETAWPEVDHLASYAQCIADQAGDNDESAAEMEVRFATWHDGNELY